MSCVVRFTHETLAPFSSPLSFDFEPEPSFVRTFDFQGPNYVASLA